MCTGRLCKRCALALDGVENQARRLILYRIGFCNGSGNLLYIVAVLDVNDMPAECIKFCSDALAMAHNVSHCAVQLALVVVYEAHQIVELVVRSKLCCLPNFAFITLAVADSYEYMVGASFYLAAQRCADSFTHALTKRTGGQIYANRLAAVGMGREICARLVQRIRRFHRIVSLEAEGRIHNRTAMSLGQYKPVTIFPARVLRVNLHDIAVQYSHGICHGHRAADMTKTARTNDLQCLQTNFRCKHTQIMQFLLVHSVLLSLS